LFEGGVLGGDPLNGVLGPFGLQVADLAEEFADAGSLVEDLGVGGFEGVLGVERPFPPSRFSPIVQISQCVAAALVRVRDGRGLANRVRGLTSTTTGPALVSSR
jgi:hypothetical protein